MNKKMILGISRDLNEIINRFDDVFVQVTDMKMAFWEDEKDCEHYVITSKGLRKADWKIINKRNWVEGASEEVMKDFKGYVNVYLRSGNRALILVCLPETF